MKKKNICRLNIQQIIFNPQKIRKQMELLFIDYYSIVNKYGIQYAQLIALINLLSHVWRYQRTINIAKNEKPLTVLILGIINI